jgi:hypothetical protein
MTLPLMNATVERTSSVIEFAPLIAGAVVVVVLGRAVMRRRYERAATRNVWRIMELREGSAVTVDPSGKAVVAVPGLIGVEAESESRGLGSPCSVSGFLAPMPMTSEHLLGVQGRVAEPRELRKDDVT